MHSFLRADVEPAYVAAASTAETREAPDALAEQEMLLMGFATSSDPSAISDEDPIKMIGPVVAAQLAGQYAGLVESGSYTEERAAEVAEAIAQNVRAAISYKTYTISDFKTDPDISYARMLAYRSDLRDALAPLLENTEPEFEIFARYIESRDPVHLERLRQVAASYRAAAKNTVEMTIPRDAVSYHKDILNAMEQFAATLETLSNHADDALASAALLRSYNDAELAMFTSFDALKLYYEQKRP